MTSFNSSQSSLSSSSLSLSLSSSSSPSFSALRWCCCCSKIVLAPLTPSVTSCAEMASLIFLVHLQLHVPLRVASQCTDCGSINSSKADRICNYFRFFISPVRSSNYFPITIIFVLLVLLGLLRSIWYMAATTRKINALRFSKHLIIRHRLRLRLRLQNYCMYPCMLK